MERLGRLYMPLIVLFFLNRVDAQDIPGYNMSNYAGVAGIDLQPACIADMRYKFDLTIVGAGIDFNNNYISAYGKYIRDGTFFQNYIGNFQDHFLNESTTPVNKEVGLNAYVQLPSFAITINRSISVAFTCRLRTMLNIDNVSPQLAHLMYTDLNTTDPLNQTYFNNTLNNNTFSINQMSWWEYGIDYAQVLYNQGNHLFKIGGRVKLEAGLEAAYLYASKFNYNWKNNDTLSLYNTVVQQGHTQTLVNDLSGNSNIGNALGNVSASSLALDIGVVYEWRPDFYELGYHYRRGSSSDRRDITKYKIRLGASILDLGVMKFTKGDQAYNFTANTTNWNVSALHFGPNKIQSLDTIIANKFGNSDTKNKFLFYLPTTFSFQVDYNIYKDLYLNFTSNTSPQWLNVTSQVHTLSYYVVTPRWDQKWFGVFLPMGINGYGQPTFGASVRLGPLIVGSSNAFNLLFASQIYGINAYAALKVPIMFNNPRKRKKESCPAF